MSAPQETPQILGKQPVPTAVKCAVGLMLVGAVASVLTIITHYSQLSGHQDQLLPSAANSGVYDPDTLRTSRDAALSSLFIVSGLIQAGLWLWLAFTCWHGRNWGRIVSTVFFGVGCLAFGIDSVAVAHTTILTTSPGAQALNALPVMIGFAATILLWSEKSGPHFNLVASP